MICDMLILLLDVRKEQIDEKTFGQNTNKRENLIKLECKTIEE